MDDKAQTAMEYLLLIGGAILIVAIVLVILNSVGSMGKNSADNGFAYVKNYINTPD